MRKLVFLLFLFVMPAHAQRALEIYFLDMAGGGSTLIVTPAGESVLIDTGSLEPVHRDADRIVAAAEHAGLKQIDYLVTTHFHSDHFGAIEEVTRRIPVKAFLDKGSPVVPGEAESNWYRTLRPLYEKATGGKSRGLAPGDDIPLRQAAGAPKLRLHVVASDGRVEGFAGDIDAPVPGFEIRKADQSDNGRSIALVLSYGDFQFFAGGDITWNVEHHLASRVGEVDLFQVGHHGMDASNNPVLLNALKPTVAVALNGPRKGIMPRAFATLKSLPSLQALYQIHYNVPNGPDGNAPAGYIANPQGTEGRFIRASVASDARTFRVQVGEDGPEKSFEVR